MKFSILILSCILIICASCGREDVKQNVGSPKQEPKSDYSRSDSGVTQMIKDGHHVLDSVFYVSVKKDIPVMKFEVWRVKEASGVSHFDDLYQVVISDSASGTIIQTIDSAATGEILNQLEFGDYNFDSYSDIYVKDRCAILGNCHGVIFLYNKSNHIFSIAHEFDELTSVTVNKVKGEISSASRSTAGLSFVYEKYKYMGNKLTLIESEQQDTPEKPNGKYHYVLRRLNANGSMQVIKDEFTEKPKLK